MSGIGTPAISLSASVQSVDLTKVGGTAFSLGQQLAASSLPVVLTAAQLSTLTPPAAITGFATSANQSTEITSLASIDGKLPALGQALAAASVPVILPSATITTLTPPAAITGFATSAKQDTIDTSINTLLKPASTLAAVTSITNPVAVTGTFFQATQPVSIATAPVLVAGTALIGKVSIDQVTANANEVVTKTGSVTEATLSAETTKVIGTINVAASQTIAVTNAGTFATQATLQAGTAEIGKLAAGVAEIGNVKNSGTFATQATLQTGSNAIGKLTANSGVDIGDVDVTSIATGTNAIGRVGHDITGIGHGVKTVTTAGTDEALAGSTACKRVVVQAQSDNTGVIAVGATGVDATIATGTGVLLFPADTFEIEIDNLADIFIDSTVSGDGVRYSYFT